MNAPDLDDVRSVTEDVWLALLGETEQLLPRMVADGAPFDPAAAWSAAADSLHVSSSAPLAFL